MKNTIIILFVFYFDPGFQTTIVDMIGKKGGDVKFNGNLNKIKSYVIIMVRGYVYGGGPVKYLILLKMKRLIIKPL